MTDPRHAAAKLCAAYVFAGLAGLVARAAGIPLPFMIGPLIAAAALQLSGVAPFTVPTRTRALGQTIVAAQVGLYFSASALAIVFAAVPLLVGLALMTLLSSLLVAAIMRQLRGVAFSEAFISSIPVGPVEAVVIAESRGMPHVPVVFTQTLRLACVVIVIPILFYALEGWPEHAAAPLAQMSDPVGLAPLALSAAVGGFVFKQARLANPFFLGPLAMSAGLTAAGVALEPFPYWMLAIAQILLGTWLGSVFKREVFRGAGPFVRNALMSTLLLVAFNAAGAIALATALGSDWRNFVLGAAPGGVTEMALTARYLALDVPLIIAFHLTRIFLIVPNVPWIVRLIHRREQAP